MTRKRLEELNLLDDFLFGSMVTHPEIGEKFIRELLQIIFCRKFGKLTVIPQKTYYGSDTDKHGTRHASALRDIQQMVETVKHDGEVSLKYMKIFEREAMLIHQGFEQGQAEERKNTERERQRADAAEEENRKLKEEIRRLQNIS